MSRRALRRLQRDVAGKALGDRDVDGALAEVVALDEAVIVEARVVQLAQDAPRLAHLLDALDLLDPDVEQPDASGARRPKTERAMAAPITAKSTSMRASAPIVAPTSSTMLSPFSVGQIAAIAGRSMPGSAFRQKRRHRHQRAGVAGRDGRVGLRRRAPPGPSATSTTSSAPCAAPGSACRPSARSRRNDGMPNCRARCGCASSTGRTASSSPKITKRRSGRRSDRDRRAADHHLGAGIAAHGVERNRDSFRHQPRLHSRSARNIAGRPLMASTEAGASSASLLQRRKRRQRAIVASGSSSI